MRIPPPKRACHSKSRRSPSTERNHRALRRLGSFMVDSASGVTPIHGGEPPPDFFHARATSSSSFRQFTIVESNPACCFKLPSTSIPNNRSGNISFRRRHTSVLERGNSNDSRQRSPMAPASSDRARLSTSFLTRLTRSISPSRNRSSKTTVTRSPFQTGSAVRGVVAARDRVRRAMLMTKGGSSY